ncbi:hypothetical protein [Flammeovirga pacifica]|uniref:Uncharacterized protein n=1 Tax=Flammeovirga pacifica TaxID=915059 RepID=A0A1S1YSZ2_FLAPC|nr:hypothetical protein [Flammeovirga pacifica]OHX64140.1 hypothetical protein NH26_21280 [Flammeovirga pacifica]
MKRSLIFLLVLLSTSLYAQINLKGYVIGKSLESNKHASSKISFGGQYGNLVTSRNNNDIIYGLTFNPEKGGSQKLLTKTEVTKFIQSLNHYFKVKMKHEANGKDGVFNGVANGCIFIVNYTHKQFPTGLHYYIEMLIYNPKLGAM